MVSKFLVVLIITRKSLPFRTANNKKKSATFWKLYPYNMKNWHQIGFNYRFNRYTWSKQSLGYGYLYERRTWKRKSSFRVHRIAINNERCVGNSVLLSAI